MMTEEQYDNLINHLFSIEERLTADTIKAAQGLSTQVLFHLMVGKFKAGFTSFMRTYGHTHEQASINAGLKKYKQQFLDDFKTMVVEVATKELKELIK